MGISLKNPPSDLGFRGKYSFAETNNNPESLVCMSSTAVEFVQKEKKLINHKGERGGGPNHFHNDSTSFICINMSELDLF